MSIRIENSLNLGAIKQKTRDVSPEALLDAAEHVLQVAQGRAPVLVDLAKANDQRRANPGELRDSGYARVIGDDVAEVGFTAYWAAWQHEKMDYHHEIGEAKYLELPLASEKDEALRILADRIGGAL